MYEQTTPPEPYSGCSNFKLTVESRKRPNLLRAIQIAMSNHSRLVAYRLDHVVEPGEQGLAGDVQSRVVLFWSDSGEDAVRLPYVLNTPEKATDFVWNWLEDAMRGRKPDLDGDCTNDGWVLTTDHRVGEYSWDHSISFSVTAIWAQHHK